MLLSAMTCRFSLSPALILHLTKGCITSAGAEAIVSSANVGLMGSTLQKNAWHHSGRQCADAAVHRAAGRSLMAHLERLPYVDSAKRHKLQIGCALATPAFGRLLPRSKHVIHCASPHVIGKVRADASDVRVLRHTYLSALRCADRLSVRSVALPAVGVGVNAFPVDQAAAAALSACVAFATAASGGSPGGLPLPQQQQQHDAGSGGSRRPSLHEIQFWFREQRALDAWIDAAESIALVPPQCK